MKKFILFACICSSIGCVFPLTSNAQEGGVYPNYVVIGAFAHQKNAVAFTRDANDHQYPARFEMNYNRNLYYVYVLTTQDRQQAFEEALKLRSDTKYWDTWVFSGPFGQVKDGGVEAHDFNPATGERIVPVKAARHESSRLSKSDGPALRDDAASPGDRPSRGGDKAAVHYDNGLKHDRSAVVTSSLAEEAELETAAPEHEQLPTQTDTDTTTQHEFPRKVNEAPLTAEEVVDKNFYFQLYRADNGARVEGEVDAVDVEKSRKMATYKAHTPVKVMLPSGRGNTVSFVCQVFGYRKQQFDFNAENPSGEIFLDENGNLVVPFELVRLQKGDIAIMYNVFFFKDAAVMRPESRYEVNNLLGLLEENPSYKITIHGHTNGNASGKIIRMEEGSKNFYSLSNTREGFGSAKKLSEERALIIRNFLVDNGIAKDRMQVKAWGGKKPIHDKHSARAVENVRVEIEILSD